MLVQKDREFLTDNWKEIESVIDFLWNYRFQNRYKAAKMDKADFVSMADYEITKAIPNYDPEKSSLKTFVNKVVSNKALTELRDVTTRDKRKSLSSATSLDIQIGEDGDVTMIDLLVDDSGKADNGNVENVAAFLKSLSRNELCCLFLKILEFDKDEIKDIMQIKDKEYSDAVKGVQIFSKIKYLRKRGA